MRIRTSAVAVLLLLAATACHADTGPQRSQRPQPRGWGALPTAPTTWHADAPARPQRPPPPTRPQRPLPATRPSRPSQPPLTPVAPDDGNGSATADVGGVAGPPLPAPTEPVMAAAPFMPPTPPADSPQMPPTQAIAEPAPGKPPTPPSGGPGVAAEEGDLRLVARVDINGYATGALQVFLDGAFGAVCANEFDPADANVACRQMGFTGGTTLPLALTGDGSRALLSEAPLQDAVVPFVLENLECAGSEARLLDCLGVMDPEERDYTSYNPEGYSFADRLGLTQCSPAGAGYAFVACGMTVGPGRGDLRLARGGLSKDGTAQYGQLEIFDRGGWGTVCEAVHRNEPRRVTRRGDNIPLTDVAVNVACRQLGFERGAKTQIPGNPEGGDLQRIPILLVGANCTGDEATLAECPGSGLGGSTETCSSDDILSISCSSSLDPEMEGRLRLMESTAGAGFEYGRLEIFVRGFWSTICDEESFTPDSAQLACSILGYDGGAPLNFFPAIGFGPENQVLVAPLPVGLASVDCDGTETSLLQCPSSQIDLRDCAIEGTNLTDATVLACGTTAAGCPAVMDAEGAVRLRGGFGTPCDALHSGFVEIFHLGEWGAVCPDGSPRDDAAANVICRQLGFPHGTAVDPTINPPDPEFDGEYASPYFQPDEAEEPLGRFWLAAVRCRGAEAALTGCDLREGFMDGIEGCPRGFGGTPVEVRLSVACRAFAVPEALEGVTSPGAEEGDVRLVGQMSVANWQVGRPEVFFEGAWGQVCTGGFDDAAANVACRQLGLGGGTISAGRLQDDLQRDGVRLVFPPPVLSQLVCTGTEASLLDCPGEENFFDGYGCFGDASDLPMIACVADAESGEEGAVRLTEADASIDDPAAGVGVLEIFHAGAWGTVCGEDPSFADPPTVTTASARVACRQLGFETGGTFRDIRSVPANATLLPPWLVGLSCQAQEATLLECGELDFGLTDTCEFKQRLFCTSQGARLLEPRLVGGRADPSGAWEYGRLQVFDGAVFSSLVEGRGGGQALGRRGVEVACRTLGYATGAQLLAADVSGLPAAESTPATLRSVQCLDGAATLADCTLERTTFVPFDAEGPGEVAILCFNPSGCTVDDTPPAQGDVRLVNPRNSNFTAQPCDDVHFGGVEFFNEGRWGRICARNRRGRETFSIDALVICRELGFPFGNLIDLQEVSDRSDRTVNAADYADYNEPEELVWATDVQCTGAEERLGDCFFPERFGNPPGSVGGTPGMPSPGISFACGRGDGGVLGVGCRRFEVEESDVIRRL